ncbi:RNA-binding S4 domain-containing protein [Candidatus Halocynthiibacter alkanivorans]|uniref:RNA-binding S4 domain-containing protein n=1 Tax=Candidatus Halocynthiibacter alkanivorans TaxID=2267619 RepID=UPI000DF2DD3B|nr:RNA-binding S4 domain-containing protein [Candidatus Halocynthiibacter alkanivorans]
MSGPTAYHPDASGQAPAPGQKIRVDKWLWFARFFKTRALANKVVTGGHLRINGDKVLKPAHNVVPGDVLTFLQGRDTRIIRLEAIGKRRGPAPEAQALYTDQTPEREYVPPAPRFEGKGRPSAKDRRNARLSRPEALE